ncbi:MAG: hypothetical protein IT429_17025 [Gemmataceae bacterium]|nr:hypothetical protein [Gemmataceae bacterium]
MATRINQRYRTVTLREDVASAGRVDRARGIIRGVKILGLESANGIDDDPDVERRVYSRRALEEAIPLYEGAKVNVNHPDDPSERRDAEDGFGVLQGVHLADDGLYADLHFLKSHPLARRVCEAAERMPNSYGLSHNADARGSRKGDAWVVEEIVKVRSVDLVRDPATTRGLFEERDVAAKKTRRIIEQDDSDDEQAVLDDDGLDLDADDASDDDGLDLDADDGADAGSGAGDWRQHLADMISAIVLDDTLDADAIKAKISHAIDTLSKGEEDDSDPDTSAAADDGEEETAEEACDDDEDDDEDRKMKESVAALARKFPGVRRLVEQVDAFEVRDRMAAKRKKARKLMEAARLPKEARTRVFLEQLLNAPGTRAMRVLVEDRKALLGRTRSLGRGSGAPSVTNPKEFAARIRSER